jgi:hypothetical protein
VETCLETATRTSMSAGTPGSMQATRTTSVSQGKKIKDAAICAE